MVQAFLLAFLLAAQDAKPAKTVEDRIKELTERIALLDQRATELTKENNDLTRRVAEASAVQESVARATATGWIQRQAARIGLDEARTRTIEGLWISWLREDSGKPAPTERWKTREDALRKELTPEQAALLEKAVRADIEAATDLSIASYGKQAGIAAEREAEFKKAVRSRVKSVEAGLIPMAHPGAGVTWLGVYTAVESSMPDLNAILTAGEHERLAKVLAQGAVRKPKQK